MRRSIISVSLCAAVIACLWLWRREPLPVYVGPLLAEPHVSPSQKSIPRIVHYVFGLADDEAARSFHFVHYICMMSALRKLAPDAIYMHHDAAPRGFFWNKFHQALNETDTTLVLEKARAVQNIHGNPISHYAHKADVVRLEALWEHGGIYLDIDVLVVRDFAPLYAYPAVMAMESQPNLDPTLPPSGLCNAVILSERRGSFVRRWLDSYVSFNASLWAAHSVSMPWRLAQQDNSDILVLNKYAFFWPLWHDGDLYWIHRMREYDFSRSPMKSPAGTPPQFAYHLWQSSAWDYLRHLSPAAYVDGALSSSFIEFTRQFLSPSFLADWRADCLRDGSLYVDCPTRR